MFPVVKIIRRLLDQSPRRLPCDYRDFYVKGPPLLTNLRDVYRKFVVIRYLISDFLFGAEYNMKEICLSVARASRAFAIVLLPIPQKPPRAFATPSFAQLGVAWKNHRDPLLSTVGSIVRNDRTERVNVRQRALLRALAYELASRRTLIQIYNSKTVDSTSSVSRRSVSRDSPRAVQGREEMYLVVR